MIIKNKDVAMLQKELKNLTAKFIGKGKHYIQEDHSDTIGKDIRDWVITSKL